MEEGRHIWPCVLHGLKLLQEGEDKDIGLLVSVFLCIMLQFKFLEHK